MVLSIAGSDPSGGAGIQADLKTFSALGAYGTCVITALTAQSTRGVSLVHEVPVDVVREQVTTLIADVRIDVVKVGMLASTQLVGVVDQLLSSGPLSTVPVVLDPVLVSTSGTQLVSDDAINAVRVLLTRADVITPNMPEAAALLGEEPAVSVREMTAQAERLLAAGARRVLVTGGHLEGPTAVDVWRDGSDGAAAELCGPRVATTASHGTGCTLSSAIAALYPRHGEWLSAAQEAKEWLTLALRHGESLKIGSGAGPVHHFHDMDRWHHPVVVTG